MFRGLLEFGLWIQQDSSSLPGPDVVSVPVTVVALWKTVVFVGDRRRVIEQSCVISSFYLMESLAITGCGDGAILLLTGII